MICEIGKSSRPVRLRPEHGRGPHIATKKSCYEVPLGPRRFRPRGRAHPQWLQAIETGIAAAPILKSYEFVLKPQLMLAGFDSFQHGIRSDLYMAEIVVDLFNGTRCHVSRLAAGKFNRPTSRRPPVPTAEWARTVVARALALYQRGPSETRDVPADQARR